MRFVVVLIVFVLVGGTEGRSAWAQGPADGSIFPAKLKIRVR